MTRGWMACAVLAWMAGSAVAQVHRCVDASGKVAYSDQACGTTATRAEQVLGNDATARQYDPDAPERNRQSIERARAIQQDMVDGAVQQSQGPAGATIMSAPRSDRATSPGAGPSTDPNPVTCDTYSPRKGCMGGSRENNPNWTARRGYYGGGGSADRQYEEEQERAAARAEAVRASNPGRMVRCDQTGCWGSNNGVRYDAVDGGRTLVGPHGATCRRSGAQYICN